MGDVFHFVKLNRLLLCGTLAAFSLTAISTPCYSQINVNANDVAFAYKMEQIYEKIKKAIDKSDSNKLIDLMFDAKFEIETYSGTSINLDKQLDTVEAEIRKRGAKIPKREFKELRKMLNYKEKKNQHRALYIEECLLNGIAYNALDEQRLFATRHNEDKKDDFEIIVPIQLTIGVTVALVGLFILVVPVIPPPIKAWGKDLIIYGGGIAADACMEAYGNNKKKEH